MFHYFRSRWRPPLCSYLRSLYIYVHIMITPKIVEIFPVETLVLERGSSSLCVWKLERVCSETQLRQVRCFNGYTGQLHVSAPTGRLQENLRSYYIYIYIYILLAILRLSSRELKFLLYMVSINFFPDYTHLLQENYGEYKHIFFTIT